MTKLTKAELDCAWVAFVAHTPCRDTDTERECWENTVAYCEKRCRRGSDPDHGELLDLCVGLIGEHRKWVDG